MVGRLLVFPAQMAQGDTVYVGPLVSLLKVGRLVVFPAKMAQEDTV